MRQKFGAQIREDPEAKTIRHRQKSSSKNKCRSSIEDEEFERFRVRGKSGGRQRKRGIKKDVRYQE